jgi:hypothetical protein
MPRKSPAGKIVRKSAAQIPRATQADLDRLRAAMQNKIDTSDIAERKSYQPLRRDAGGRPLPRKSVIREAVARAIKQRRLTVYRLWQLARAHYPSLSQAAVHEFLKGRRQLELPSIEALLAAVNLRVVPGRDPPRQPPMKTRKVGAKHNAS